MFLCKISLSMQALWHNSWKHCVSSSAFNIWVFPFSSGSRLLDYEPPKTNFKPMWMNKLDGRQKSCLESSSNKSLLGQATQKKQKLSLCKSSAFQEMKKLPTLLLQGSWSCPKLHSRACHLFPPMSPGASPLLPHRCCSAHLLFGTLGWLWD